MYYYNWWGYQPNTGNGMTGGYVQDNMSYGCGIEVAKDFSFGFGHRIYNGGFR
jgi:hypothetical protein